MTAGPRIFISYRRDDCMVHAGRLAENLVARAGAHVFLDIESIPPGVNFPDFIAREIASCGVALVMIGDDWLHATDEAGARRLADPLDWVHLEIAAALDRGVLTVPVLVENARMPRPQDLPSPLANLALRNAVELRDRSWPQDVDGLISALPRLPQTATDPTATPAQTWPSRFTDAWFAANVPTLDDAGLRALRAELYGRSWTDDEIASRVLIHQADAPREAGEPTHIEPEAFPSRFTDTWFAAHVGGMDAERLSQLQVVLRARNWTDAEIAERVLIHAAPQALSRPGAPNVDGADETAARTARPVIGRLDAHDPVGQATVEAAADLAHMALDPMAKIRERHLADALASHLPRAVAERKLHVPGWDPQPGNVDVFTVDRLGRTDLVIETKLKEGDQVFECLWDMAKMLSLATEKHVDAAYLVTGSTVESWQRPVACAELFHSGQHNLVAAIGQRYRELWTKYILGDSRGRPSAVPDLMQVELVAEVRYLVRQTEWELRAIKVSTAPDARWVPFSDGLPTG